VTFPKHSRGKTNSFAPGNFWGRNSKGEGDEETKTLPRKIRPAMSQDLVDKSKNNPTCFRIRTGSIAMATAIAYNVEFGSEHFPKQT
jgi:hypothetical protein